MVNVELDPNEKVAGTVVDEPPLVGAPNTKPPKAPALPLSVVDVPFDGLLKKSNELPPDGAVDLKPPKLAKAPGLPSYLIEYNTTSITSEFDLPNSFLIRINYALVNIFYRWLNSSSLSFFDNSSFQNIFICL